MGQYFFVCNTRKKQFLHPHRFDDGLKLFELSSGHTMLGLAVLLADGDDPVRSSSPLVGSWAGDPIVFAGDYAAEGSNVSDEDAAAWLKKQEAELSSEYSGADLIRRSKALEEYRREEKKPTLYEVAGATYTDISGQVLDVLCEHKWFCQSFAKSYLLRPFPPMHETVDSLPSLKAKIDTVIAEGGWTAESLRAEEAKH